MILELLPLFVILLGLGVLALAPVVPRIDRVLTRLALAAFGSYARQRERVNTRQVQTLHGAHVDTTYRVYAAKTFLYATIAALVASLLTVYIVAGVLILLLAPSGEALRARLPATVASLAGSGSLSVLQVFVVFLLSAATVGVAVALATYRLRWSMLSYRASERRRRIDATLERNVAFMYALSRSGMAFPEILRILARNRDVYGETATEISVAVKDIDLFGADVIGAMRRMANRTPSDEFSEFCENLVSVLQSGQSLPNFLRDEYEYYKEESESQQQQFLELLATLAEGYVTVFVAGPLFLITILVIVGLVSGGMLPVLRAVAYIVLPLATLGFVVYLDSVTEDSHITRGDRGDRDDVRFQDIPRRGETTVADGGQHDNVARLAIHRRLEPIKYRLRNPIEQVRSNPESLLLVTIPLALLYVGADAWFAYTAGDFGLRAIDDPLILASIGVLATYAGVYELESRRIKNIEAAIPDLLERLASTNEAGMPIVASFGRVVGSQLGSLSEELKKTWTDITWNGRVEPALERFENRLQTTTVTRVVTLITNAMNASGDIGPVLRIAADEAKATQRLRRERRNELLTYLVVIYLAFFVFLTIVVALDTMFIPSLPSGELFSVSSPAGGSVTGIGNLGIGGANVDKDAYSLVFFHTCAIQAVCSGFVAGQMGEGSVKAGAKHATAMLTIAYLVFLAFA
ncbi:type II secretion system F family protein [Salarchaeum japonicum]|uniref:Type II secretion system F family protein n=1 Tax=Salarchaeum japonicum TaxID=555573 RepID=A0AAV3T4T4_9EURY|nr:type II secretion system F family protein [Salarchaeum japonicum]